MMNIQSDNSVSGSGSSEDLRLRITGRTGGGDEGSNTDQHIQLDWDPYADAGYDNRRHSNDFRWIRESSSDHALSSESNRQEEYQFVGTFTHENESEFHSVASTEYLSVDDDDVNQIIRSENQQVKLTFQKMALQLNLDVTVSDVDPATGKLELTCSTGDRTESYRGIYRDGNIANCEMWLNEQCMQQQPIRGSSSDIELISEGPLFSESEHLSAENLKSSSDSKLSYDTKTTNTNDETKMKHFQTRYDDIQSTYRLLSFSEEAESINLNRQIDESSTSLDRLIAWYNNGCSPSFESSDSDAEKTPEILFQPQIITIDGPRRQDFPFGIVCTGGCDKGPTKEEIIRFSSEDLHLTTDLPSPPSTPPSSPEDSFEGTHSSESDTSVADVGNNTSPLNDSRPSWLTIYTSNTQFEPDESNTWSESSSLHEQVSSVAESSVVLGGLSNQQCYSGETSAEIRHGRNLQDLSESGEETTSQVFLKGNSKDDSYNLEDQSSTIEHRSSTLKDHSSTIDDNSSNIEENYFNTEDHFSTLKDHFSTQEDHSSTSDDHSSTIEDHSSTLKDPSSTKEDNYFNLEDNSSTLEGHSSTIEDHSSTPEDHSSTLEDNSSNLEDNSSSPEDRYCVGGISNRTQTWTSKHVQTKSITEELCAQGISCPMKNNSSSALFDSALESMLLEVTDSTIPFTNHMLACDTAAKATTTSRHEDDKESENVSGVFHLEPLSSCSNLSDLTSDSQPSNDVETNDETRETVSSGTVSSGGIIDAESYSETSSEKTQYETSAFIPVYSLTDIINENTGHAVDHDSKTENQCNPDTNARSCDEAEDSLFLFNIVPSEEEHRKQSHRSMQEVYERSSAEQDRKNNEEKLRLLAASYGLLDDSGELESYESYDSDDSEMPVSATKDKVKSPSLPDDASNVAVDSSVTSDDDHLNKENPLGEYQILSETSRDDMSRQTNSAISSSISDPENKTGVTSSAVTSCETSEKDFATESSSTYNGILPSLCQVKDPAYLCPADEIQNRLNKHKQSQTFHSNDSFFSFSDQDQVDFLMKFQCYVESLDICIPDRHAPRGMLFHADDGRFSCFDENQVEDYNQRKFLGNHVVPLKTENVESMKMNHLSDSTDLLDDIARKMATQIISDISLCQVKSYSTSQSLSDATMRNSYSSDNGFLSNVSFETQNGNDLSTPEDSGPNTKSTSSVVSSCPYFDDISRLDVFPSSVDDVGEWPISTTSINDLASRSHSQFIDLFNTEKHVDLINYSLNVYKEGEEDAHVKLSDNKYEQCCVCDSETESPVSEEDIARMPSDRYSFSVNSGTFMHHDEYDTDKRDTSKGTIMAEVEHDALAQYACLLVKDVITSAHKKFVWSMEGLQDKDRETSSGSESASSVEELVSSAILTNHINAKNKIETNEDEHSGVKSDNFQSDNNCSVIITSRTDDTRRTSCLDYYRTVVATGLSSIAIRQGMNELRLVACKEWYSRSHSSGSVIDQSAVETDSSEQEPKVDNYTKYKSKLRELKMRRQRGGRWEQNKERLMSRPLEKKYLTPHQFRESSSDEASDDDSSVDIDDLEECDRQVITALHKENNETTILEIENVLDTETMLLKAKQAHHLRRLEKYREKAESSLPSALCPDHNDSFLTSKESQRKPCLCTVEKADALRNIAYEILRGKQLLNTQHCISKMEDELMAMRKRIDTGQKAVFNRQSLDSLIYGNTEDQAKLTMQTETEALKTFLYKNIADFEKAITERPIFGAGDLKRIEDHTPDFTAFGRIINQEIKEFKDTVDVAWEDIQDRIRKEFEKCLNLEENEHSVQNNIDGFEPQESTDKQLKEDSEESEHLMKEEPDDIPSDDTEKLARIAEKAFRLHMSRRFLTEENKHLKNCRLGVDPAAPLPAKLNSPEGDRPPLVTPRCSICKLRKKVNKVESSEANEKSDINNTMETKQDLSTTVKRFGGHEYEVVTGCGIRKHTMTCALCRAIEEAGW